MIINSNFNFSSLPFLISKIYFWFSFLFLVARTSVTILVGAQVYESARRPYKVLRAVPSEMWSEELQRFFDQIKLETNALSGKNFFFVQRRLLFSMACALLTYELVLLQFSDDGDGNVHDAINCKGMT
jgi:gustatory receptor